VGIHEGVTAGVPMTTSLPALLLAGSSSDRETAYAALEATRDVALGAASVAPLALVLGKPAAEVDAVEYRRAMGVLAHLVPLDPVRVGGEWIKDMKFLSSTAKGNAVDVIVSKPAAEMTKDDARTVAAILSQFVALASRGLDPVFAAGGCSALEWFSARMSQDSAWNALVRTQPDETKLLRLATLVLELLREDRDKSKMSEAEVAGGLYLFEDFCTASTAVCLHAMEAGVVGFAIEELRTGSPGDWVSVSRDPSAKFASAILCIGNIATGLSSEHKHLLAATPRLLDVLLDGMKAYETAGSAEDMNIPAVYWLVQALYGVQPALFAFSGANCTAVRSASSIQFLLDNPLDLIKEFGVTTNMIAVRGYILVLRDQNINAEFSLSHFLALLLCFMPGMACISRVRPR
jgi:hypothetical protein